MSSNAPAQELQHLDEQLDGSGHNPPPHRDRGLYLPVTWQSLVAMVGFYAALLIVLHLHKLAGAVMLVTGVVIFAQPLGRLLERYLVQSWRTLNAEAAALRAAEPPDSFDRRTLVVAVTAAIVLTLMEYYGGRPVFRELAARFWPHFSTHRYYELAGYGYWSGFRLLNYLLLPLLAVRLMPGERLRDYGLSFAGIKKHLWVYGLLYAIILPALIVVSFTPAFQRTYPFYDGAARSWLDYAAWEMLYAVQFFALELFFRGFMLHPLKRALGSYAIFAMAVPYCMIHYHKPLPEVFGAVIAGIVLGTLSLRTRSIWCGWLIHVSVAWTMDGLSLFQKVGYPGNPRYVG